MMNPLTRMSLESVSKRLEQLLVSDFCALITIQFCNGVDKTRIGPDRTGPDHGPGHGQDHGSDHRSDQIREKISIQIH